MSSTWGASTRRRGSKPRIREPATTADKPSVTVTQSIIAAREKIETAKSQLPETMVRLKTLADRIEVMTPPKRHEHHILAELKREHECLAKYVFDLKGGVIMRDLQTRVKPYIQALDKLGTQGAAVKSVPRPKAPGVQVVRTGRARRARRRTPKDMRTLRVKNNSRDDSGRLNADLIQDEYRHAFGISSPPIYIVSGDDCPHCGSNGQMRKLADESMMCCSTCGKAQTYVDTTALSLGYGEDADFASFSYRRDNHFREWLQCFQGKESTIIPITVMESVAAELQAQHIRPRDIDHKKIRAVLKKLKLRKFYENTTLLTCRLTGRKPPRLSSHEEEQLRRMFMAIQAPFEKHCPTDRKNFLSYSYCLYKFCELLRLDGYLKHFSLLKGRDKLFKQDQIFQLICGELNWQYIPSV